MSDLQDLIHKSCLSAHYQGIVRERERIVKLLKEHLQTDELREELLALISKESQDAGTK